MYRRSVTLLIRPLVRQRQRTILHTAKADQLTVHQATLRSFLLQGTPRPQSSIGLPVPFLVLQCHSPHQQENDVARTA